MERLFTHSHSASKVCYSAIFSQTILLSLSLESLRKKFLRLGTEGGAHIIDVVAICRARGGGHVCLPPLADAAEKIKFS